MSTYSADQLGRGKRLADSAEQIARDAATDLSELRRAQDRHLIGRVAGTAGPDVKTVGDALSAAGLVGPDDGPPTAEIPAVPADYRTAVQMYVMQTSEANMQAQMIHNRWSPTARAVVQPFTVSRKQADREAQELGSMAFTLANALQFATLGTAGAIAYVAENFGAVHAQNMVDALFAADAAARGTDGGDGTSPVGDAIVRVLRQPAPARLVPLSAAGADAQSEG
jgi:hypothetical protein